MKNWQSGQIPGFLSGSPEKKQSAAASAVYMQWQGSPTWMPRDYASFAKEGYMENAIVFRCIRLIAEACKAIPLLVYADDQPVEEHEFLDLIAYPNPFEPASDVLDDLYSFLQIAGNSYLEAVMMGGKPQELYVLRPDRMKIILGPKGRPQTYVYRVGSQEVRYQVPPRGQMPIMHLKTMHPLNDIYGLSPIEPAAKSIDTHNAAGAYNASLLQNMGRPSGALIIKGEDDNQLTQDQFDRLKAQIEQQTGPSNAGKPLLLEGGMEWQPFAFTAQDMEFVNGKNSAARDIALSLGVPPQILGIPGDNTYSNLKEANVAFYRQTIIPTVIKVCQHLSVFFRPSYGDDFKVWFDIDEIAGLTGEREEKWRMVDASTTLTVNEKREAIGYEERDEGDVILISSSMIPLDEDIGEDEAVEGQIDPITGLPIEDSEEPDDGESGGSSEDQLEEDPDQDE